MFLFYFNKGTTGATLIGGNMIAQNMCLGMYFYLIGQSQSE